jgi:molybdopterin-guanine dinucleotide biosynthesis protein A
MVGIILSGGKSRRMGTNKAFLEFDGERLIDRTVRLFRDLFSEVIIVTSSPLDYFDQPAAVVTDILPERGALGGIYTGLFHAPGEQAFFAACDMPFLNPAFIAHMVQHASGYDIVVPVTSAGPQPLHAIYARRLLPVIRGLLDRDRLKITGFYGGHRILEIPSTVQEAFDPDGRMFVNINRPSDLSSQHPPASESRCLGDRKTFLAPK